jgi:hypothetical protein
MFRKALLEAMKADIRAAVNDSYTQEKELPEDDNEAWTGWLAQINAVTTFKELMEVFVQWDEELGEENFAELMDDLFA